MISARAGHHGASAERSTIGRIVGAIIVVPLTRTEVCANLLKGQLALSLKARKLSEHEVCSFRSGGSGVIVDAELGLIGTNNHVVRDAISIIVGLRDGREAPATPIGIDSDTDIALIKIELPNLTSLPFGNSSDLRVGDFVIAIGNPFGLEATATPGIVHVLVICTSCCDKRRARCAPSSRALPSP